MNKQWYGCNPEQPDDLNEDHFDHVGLMAANNIVDIEAPVVLPYMPTQVMDQGPLGSCTAYGTQNECRYNIIERMALNPSHGTYDFEFSELMLYFLSRLKEGTQDLDSGAQIRDVISVLTDVGAAQEEYWKYDVAKFNQPPPDITKLDATQYRAFGAKRVKVDRDAILTCLHIQKRPVVIGISVFQSFESTSVENTGQVPMPVRGDRNVGGHCMCLYGWDGKVFRVRNQWGSWGAPIPNSTTKGDCFLLPGYVGSQEFGADYWMIPKFGSAAELAAGTI